MNMVNRDSTQRPSAVRTASPWWGWAQREYANCFSMVLAAHGSEVQEGELLFQNGATDTQDFLLSLHERAGRSYPSYVSESLQHPVLPLTSIVQFREDKKNKEISCNILKTSQFIIIYISSNGTVLSIRFIENSQRKEYKISSQPCKHIFMDP